MTVKGELYQFYKSKCISKCSGMLLSAYVKKYKAFIVYRGSCMKSDKLPRGISPESVSLGAENYTFKNEEISGGVELEQDLCSLLLISAASLRLR